MLIGFMHNTCRATTQETKLVSAAETVRCIFFVRPRPLGGTLTQNSLQAETITNLHWRSMSGLDCAHSVRALLVAFLVPGLLRFYAFF